MYVVSALERLKQKDHKFETSLSYVIRAISKTAANVKSLVPELQKLAKVKKLQENDSYAWLPNTKSHRLEFILSILYSWSYITRKITSYKIDLIWWFPTLDPSWILLVICVFVLSCFSHYCAFPSNTLTLGQGMYKARLADKLTLSRLTNVPTQGTVDKHLEADFAENHIFKDFRNMWLTKKCCEQYLLNQKYLGNYK